MYKTLIAALLAIASSLTSSAQQLQATLSHYTIENGLCSNTISHLAQDDYGYIWISTWNGLSRFDGYEFYNYQTGAGSHIPNLHNRVKDISIDNMQNIWMQMYDGRVFVVKRSIDTIINPFEEISGSEDFRTNDPITVTSIGEVIVNVTDVGLYKMSVGQDHIQAQLITTNGLHVTSMAEGYQNDIWLGTDKGVHRMDVSNLTVEQKGYFLDEEITKLYSNGYNIFVGTKSGKILSFSYGQNPAVIRSGGSRITGLFVDSHGLVWFSDANAGVARIKPNSMDEKRFVQRVVVPDYDGLGAEFNEANGYVWMRMCKGGYGYYNRETDEVEYFHNDPSNSWNLSNTVNARLEMNEGVVWESTSRRALEKLEIMRKVIDRVQVYPGEENSMNNEVRAMIYDASRQQFIFANKSGTMFFVNAGQVVQTLSKDRNGNPLGRIYGISLDSKGNYWVSCKGDGIYRITPQGSGFDIKNYRHDDNDTWSINDDRAYCTVEDKDGNIWVATYGGGVNILTNPDKGKSGFLNVKNSMRKYPYNSHRKVRTLALDSDGNVWAGTTDGILVMSYHDKKLLIEPLATSKTDPDKILMSNDIVCIAQDRHGAMWVGTNGGGLAHTVGKDANGCWLFENFGSRDGLPSEEIKSLVFDNRDNVWFSTDHVLCSYDVDKNIFTTFSYLEGVDETMCSEGSAVCFPNGNIVFGTVNGYYVVDRTKLVTAAGNLLKLRITDFWLNDELQTPRKNSPISYYVPDSKSVELPNHSDIFSFRFASLNYQLQHRVHYQYMLEGYDHNWQNADRDRIATYGNIPTGSYRFKVKAFLLESPEKYDMRQIEVVVPPYFLLSSNAIWLYMIIAIVLGIWLMFKREKQLEKEEKLRMLREGPRQKKVQVVNNDFMIFLNEFLDIHFSDPMLSVEEMVAASDQDEAEFNLTLRKLTGQSPKEYVHEFRLKKAVEMIETTDMSIAEVAFNCGFVDPATFNRQFSQKTGFTPSKYRDLHKKIKGVESPPDT